MDESLLAGKTLLVVDDEVDLRDIVASELEFLGAKVFQAENISQAKEILESHKINLIVSDIRMPGGTGIDLLNYVKNLNADKPPVILITGFADVTLEEAYHKGAEALINKPFKLDELIQLILRFTEPMKSKLMVETANKSLEMNFEGPLSQQIQNKECAVGRGGITVTGDLTHTKVEIGQMVQLKMKFDDQTLNGKAICRWCRSLDPGSQKVHIGFELMSADEATVNSLGLYTQGQQLVPYIPSLN